MEKYSKILIYIFLLCILNTVVSLFVIFKIVDQPVTQKASMITLNNDKVKTSPSPTSQPKAADQNDIRADLTIIKAEIRSIRESLNSSGLILGTPKP